MFKLIKTNNFFFWSYTKTDCLFKNYKHNCNCYDSPKDCNSHTAKLLQKLCKSTAVEKTFFNSGKFKSRSCICSKKTNSKCSPDTVHHVYANSTNWVINVKHIVQKPYTKDYKKTGNKTDYCSTCTVSNVTRSCNSNKTSQRCVQTH